ncbi:MAG TPA: xylose isomerase [Cytophagales bacterium]|nr:xylose isomerase [Cytophagales bacterium]
MKQSRREFIKTSALALSAVSLSNTSLFSMGAAKPKLGIQLYTVRKAMEKNPLETLKAIASIGYKYVEHAKYSERKFYGYAPKEFKKILADLGMKMPSGHTRIEKRHWDAAKKDFTAEWKYTIEDAATAGQEYVISPSMEESIYASESTLKQFLDVFNKCGELCQKSGMKFGYHNHDFEFEKLLNNRSVYDIIMTSTDPKLVAQQLDTGNLFNGGAKAIDIIKKYPKRFELMHVKDEVEVPLGHAKFESTVLGVGVAQVKEVIDLGAAGGVKYMIVEQESYHGKDPIDCAREDYQAMKNWGY